VLFNSFPFIFVFLPLAFLGHEILRRLDPPRCRQIWLIGASAVFYACNGPNTLLGAQEMRAT
jgi:alginate O-acetyltransferase complex protein AlgI